MVVLSLLILSHSYMFKQAEVDLSWSIKYS